MDITIQVLLKPATNILEGITNARRYIAGDIIDIYKANKWATLQPDGNYILDKAPIHPRFAFIHVKSVPETIDEHRIKEVLLSSLYIVDDLVRLRKWHIPPSILPEIFKQKLLEEKEATVTFTQAKAYIRKKNTPVILDSVHDDISTSLTDEDII